MTIKDLVSDPKKIIKELDKYVIGQDRAKKAISIMLLNRELLILNSMGKIKISNLEKTNILLMGPSGSGKTSLLRALQKVSNIPITIFDISKITPDGYRGQSTKDVFKSHILNVENYFKNNVLNIFESSEDYENPERAFKNSINFGIIYLDEFDKIHQKYDSDWELRIQARLLTLLEEDDVTFTDGVGDANIKSINTKNILFICGGAFSRIKDVILKRLNKKNSIGFISEGTSRNENNLTVDYYPLIKNEDLITYGFIPELIGRLPLKIGLNNITKDILHTLLTEDIEGSVYTQYKNLFCELGIDIKFTEGAINLIIKTCLENESGARALKEIFSSIFLEELVNIHSLESDTLTITKSIVGERLCI